MTAEYISPRPLKDLSEIVDAKEIIPWKVTELTVRPFAGMWGFNPSIHFDGQIWRCSIRCADYAMPGGDTIRGSRARTGYVQNKNAMVILDPDTWQPIRVHEMRELDEYPRAPTCTNLGFEDMRLFRTEAYGLQAVSACLHLDRRELHGVYNAPNVVPARAPDRSLGRRRVSDRAQPAPRSSATAPVVAQSGVIQLPPEQAILSFDEAYNIVDVRPIRGPWSGRPQKNWSPFDACHEPRFLFAIEEGVIFNEEGPLTPMGGPQMPPIEPGLATRHGGTEVKITRKAVVMAAGRTMPTGYGGIRGGTQLIYLDDALSQMVGYVEGGAWLGIGHEMRYVRGRKHYWHTFYVVDGGGGMLACSPALKLAPDGIEFAAGMAIDGDRVVISFGVDDMLCFIGETKLADVLAILDPNFEARDTRRRPEPARFRAHANGSNGTNGANGKHDNGRAPAICRHEPIVAVPPELEVAMEAPVDDPADESEAIPPANVTVWKPGTTESPITK